MMDEGKETKACCPAGSMGEAPAFASNSNNHVQGTMVEIPAPTPPSKDEDSSNHHQLSDMPCYMTGAPLSTADSIVVIFTDVYGLESGRHKVFADLLVAATTTSSSNTAVLIPDLFRGDPILKPWIPSTSFATELLGSALGAPGMVYRIKTQYPPHKVEADVFQLLLPWIQSQIQSQVQEQVQSTTVKLSCIGFCFGGWVVGRVLGYDSSDSDSNNTSNNNSNSLQFQCGVGIHPSFQPNVVHGESQLEMATRIRKPILLLPANNDYDLKPGSEVVDAIVANINNSCNNGNGKDESSTTVSIEFPTMNHGWVTRGDSNDPDIAAEQERALQLAVEFIQKHG